MALCELCGKMFMDNSYLKYHCFRRHKLNSCTFTNSLDNEYVDSLKSEILQLQTQLKETTLTLENKLKVKYIIRLYPFILCVYLILNRYRC